MKPSKNQLSGFATAELPELVLLVGQNANAAFTLKVATFAESVIVSSQAPLVDTQNSQVAGNVDRHQIEALPLQGRNWMTLSMLVKGITANDVSTSPGVGRDELFELNLDGQQVTQHLGQARYGQPKFSQEAIAEFQIVTQLFDITEGRSTGIQVRAITKAGTNTLSGSSRRSCDRCCAARRLGSARGRRCATSSTSETWATRSPRSSTPT